MSDCCSSKNPDHSAEVARLNRVAGQIEGVKQMIAEKRYCPEIIAQLRAVQAATKAIESELLKRHLGACVKEAFQSNDATEVDTKIDELMRIFQKLD